LTARRVAHNMPGHRGKYLVCKYLVG
jgi:hypothetical protein